MAGNSEFSTRDFAIGPIGFRVQCSNESLIEAIERAFADLDPAKPDCNIEAFHVDGDAESLVLRVPDGRTVPSQPINGMLTSLVTSVSRLALDHDPTRLHLHGAGLVSRSGVGVVISAPSGGGKTTLAATLSRMGWTYLTDEAVAMTLDSTQGGAFPKPLTIKPGGQSLVDHLDAQRVAPAPGDEWWHVPVGATGGAVTTSFDPSALVFLRPDFGLSDEILTMMHPVDAVVSLLDQTMDAERFGQHTIDLLAGLAARSRCAALTVSSPDAMAESLEGLVDRPLEVLATSRLEHDGTDHLGSWRPHPSVRSVLIRDRAVLHQLDNGRVVALDEAGTAVWLAVFGRPPAWWPAEARTADVTNQFLDVLRTHELVTDDGSSGRDD